MRIELAAAAVAGDCQLRLMPAGPTRHSNGLHAYATPNIARNPALIPGADPRVFYINRNADSDRRLRIERQLTNCALAAERTSAIEGTEVPTDLRNFFFHKGTMCARLTSGEVGCYASHLSIYRRIVELELPCALVLEDDALLAPGFDEKISQVMARMQGTKWDIIHLSGQPTRAIKRLHSLAGIGDVVIYSRIPAGTQGYLISASGAKRMLAPVVRDWPIDTDFRRPWRFGLNVYGVFPPVVGHDESLPSTIPIKSGRRRGLQRPSREAWTGNPLHCPEGTLHNIRRLGFFIWLKAMVWNLRKSDKRRLTGVAVLES
jgi:glycosyl transferase, family 25